MTQAEFLNASETHGQHGYRLLSKSEPFTVTANEASTLFSQVTETLGIRKKKGTRPDLPRQPRDRMHAPCQETGRSHLVQNQPAQGHKHPAPEVLP